MTYEEKLQKIVSKLKDERDLTRKGHVTRVTFDDRSFTKLQIGEVCKILLKLQDDDGAVKILDALQRLETVPTEKIISPSDDDDYEGVEVITVGLGEEFDNWYESYLLKQKSKPENLDWLNLLKVVDVCSDIDQQLQIARSATVTIPSFPYPYLGRYLELFPYDSIGTRKSYQQYRWEGAQYLLKRGIALEARYDRDDSLGYGDIVIRVDSVKFDDFYKAIKDEFEKRKESDGKADSEKVDENTKRVTSQPLEEESEVVYKITYTKQRQILMNNAQIGKPDFNSENDLVFSFLYANPNESFTNEQIEKAVGVKLNKSLHKIVENLGFEGDTKEVFISVSKSAIQFRNPITKKDLEEMRKPLIKLVKGGGKLLLPR